MTLLAIDPGRSFKGEDSIGYAIFDEALGGDKAVRRGSLSWEEFIEALNTYDNFEDSGIPALVFGGTKPLQTEHRIYEVVIEDFVNNSQSKGGQRNGTSECIGAVEFACIKAGVPFTRQEPAALGPAKLHAPEGSWKKLKHLRHEDSAYLHGYEYLVRTGRLQPAGLADTL